MTYPRKPGVGWGGEEADDGREATRGKPDLCGIIARIVDDPDHSVGDIAALTAYGITSGILAMPKAAQRLYLNTLADTLIRAAHEVVG